MPDLKESTTFSQEQLDRFARILRTRDGGSSLDDSAKEFSEEQKQRFRMIAGANMSSRTMIPGRWGAAPVEDVGGEGALGYAKQFAHGLISTIPQSMIVLGSLVDLAADTIAGEDIDADFMAESGITFQNWLDDNVAVENPNFFHHLMGGIGSMVSFGGPAVTAFKVAGKITTAMKMGDKAAKMFKSAFGLGVMSVLEAGVEQGQLQQELMESGMSTGEALAKSQEIFFYNLPMLLATNAGYFHPASRVARMLLEAPMEGGQERFQGVVQDVVSGRGEWKDFFDWRKYQTETAVGAIVGGGAALAMPGEGKAKEPKEPGEAPTAPEFEDQTVEGFTEARPKPSEGPGAPGVPLGGEPPLTGQPGAPAERFAPEPQDEPQRIRLERVHAEQDERDRVIGQEWDDERMMSELEDGLIEEYGTEFSIRERLEDPEYNELLTMVQASYAERDAFTKMDMIEATVKRAKEFLFGGKKSDTGAGVPSPAGEVVNGGIDAAPVSAPPAGSTTPAPAPIVDEAPAKAVAPKPETAAGRWQVHHVPMGDVTFRREDMQNREAEFSERTAAAVAESYDERLMDPVDLWRDPDSGDLVMVEGHSRFEGLRRRRESTIPGFIYEDMTFDEAQKLAAEKNKSRDAGNTLDDVKLLRNEVKRGKLNKGQATARASELFKRNAPTVMALMHLNPKGKLISTIRSMTAASDEGLTEIMQMAKWVGAVRRGNPKLTDAHEREMADDLLINYKKRNTHQNAATYRDFIDNRTNTLLGFDYSQPLNLKEAKPLGTPADETYDAEIAAAKQAWQDAQKAQKTKLEEFKGMSLEAQKKAMVKYNDDVLITKREYEDLVARRSDIKLASLGEKTLFRISVETLKPGEALRTVRRMAKGMGLMGNVAQSSPKGSEFDLIQRVGRLFGADVSFFKATEGMEAIGGVYAGNRILLNENSDIPLLYVLMHEVGHFMEHNHADLWNTVADVAMRNVSPGGWETFKAKAMMRGAVSPKQIRQEFVSDTIAEAAMREEFWRDLKATDPQGFSIVVQKIRDVLATIRKFLVEHNESISHYFSNFAAVENAIRAAGAEMAKRTREQRVAVRTAQEVASGQQAMFRTHIPADATPEMRTKLEEQDAAEKKSKTKRSWSGVWHYLYTQMVDDRHPLYVAIKRALKAVNIDIYDYDWIKNPYKVVQSVSGWHGNAKMSLKEVVLPWEGGEPLSDGLEVIFAKYGLAPGIESGEFGMFEQAARQHALYEEKGDDYIGDDPSSDEFAYAMEKFQEYERIYEQYSGRETGEAGTWKDAADAITKFCNAVMKRGVGSGMISQETYDRLIKKYGVFAPLYVLDMVDSKGQWAGGKPKAFAGKPFFEQGRFIPDAVRMDPIDAIIKNTYKLEFMFTQNYAKLSLTNFIMELAPKSWSVAGIGKKIDPKMRPWKKTGRALLEAMGLDLRNTETYKQKYKELKKLQKDQRGGQMTLLGEQIPVEEITDEMISEAALEAGMKETGGILADLGIDPKALGDVHNIWTVSAWQREGTIALMRDGEIEYWQVSPDLVHVFAAGPRGIGHQFMKFFTAQTALMRAGAILTPDFMGRNIVRDFQSASIMGTQLVNNPIDAVVLPFRILRGLSQSINKGEMWKEWVTQRGAHAQMVSVDQEHLRLEVEDLSKGHGAKDRVLYGLKGPRRFFLHSRPDKAVLHSLQFASAQFENATRLAVYEKTRNDLISKGLPETEAKFRAMIESREASLDFNRMGKTGAVINQLIPFFNASVQGHDKLMRSLFRDKGRRGKTWTKGVLLLTMPSVLLWCLNMDEEWYDDMPLWMKNHFWLFSLDGGKTIHKIPKPFEVGLLFASMPERFLDWRYKKDKKAMRAWADDWLDQIATFKPWELAGPMAYTTSEMLSNYDSFRDAPIVKGRMQDLENKQQYTGKTTEVAKVIGGLVGGEGWSPAKIDHFIRGSFGGLGHMAAELTSTFIYMADPTRLKVRPEARKFYGVIPDWVPVARAFLETSPPTYSRYKNEFYDMLDVSTEATNTLRHFLKTGADPSEIADLYRRRYVEIGMHEGLSRVSDRLGKLHGAIRTIDYDRSGRLTRTQKRERRDRLYAEGNDLVRAAVKKINEEAEKARTRGAAMVEIEANRLEQMARRQRAKLKGK